MNKSYGPSSDARGNVAPETDNHDRSREASVVTDFVTPLLYGGIVAGTIDIAAACGRHPARTPAASPHLMYETIFKSPAALKVEFWDYTTHLTGEVFLAVGRERGSNLAGGQQCDLSIQTSRVLRRYDGK